VQRLTGECNALGEDTFSEGTLRNAVNGIDPMRPGRIKVICRVLAKYGDGIPYGRLVEDGEGRCGAEGSNPLSSTPPAVRRCIPWAG
jgi:hypothetical protein